MSNHRCTVCGQSGPWGDGWQWYGSLDNVLVITCSEECREKAEQTGLVPKNATLIG